MLPFGKNILSSPPDSIVTSVNRSVLTHFKESRENNPAVGLTGLETFIRALQVLLKVIGTLSMAKRRGVPTTNNNITQKLGWDQWSRQIFSDLGWREDTMPDAGMPSPLPRQRPPMRSARTRIFAATHAPGSN